LGISQEYLGEQISMCRVSVSRLESGKRPLYAHEIIPLCLALNAPAVALIPVPKVRPKRAKPKSDQQLAHDLTAKNNPSNSTENSDR
jgi:transcriptional regulator with XRE-family HTH domain